MKIIEDQNVVKYRISLQNERDYLLNDYKLQIEDLYERFKQNTITKKSLFDKTDLLNIYKVIFDIARIHLELQFGSLWQKQTDGIQKKIVQSVISEVIKRIKNKDEKFIQNCQTNTLLMLDDACVKMTTEV